MLIKHIKAITIQSLFGLSILMASTSSYSLPSGCLKISGFGSDFRIRTSCERVQLANFNHCESCQGIKAPPLVLKHHVSIQYYPPGCKPIQLCDAERNCIQLEDCN